MNDQFAVEVTNGNAIIYATKNTIADTKIRKVQAMKKVIAPKNTIQVMFLDIEFIRKSKYISSIF